MSGALEIRAEKKEWFENWFDSPYHELLYKKRDEVEAKLFIDVLMNYLAIPADAKVFDIACGDGRHAAFLAQYVAEVIGIDLSTRRINNALKLSTNNLAFYRHDMRQVFRSNYFDSAFNFYTSFGYFQKYRDNISAAKAFAASLKSGGTLMVDYMNVAVVQANLVVAEEQTIEGIHFNISRAAKDGKIVKKIEITDSEKGAYTFEERVSAFSLNDFEAIFTHTDLQLVETFGDYDLSAFDVKESPRLIMLFKKA